MDTNECSLTEANNKNRKPWQPARAQIPFLFYIYKLKTKSDKKKKKKEKKGREKKESQGNI